MELNTRDETVMPAVCYDACDSAYKEVQVMGKVSSICESNSAFMNGYMACVKCIEETSTDSKTTIATHVDPKFAQFLEFCAGGVPARPSYAASMITVVTRTQFVDVTGFSGAVESGVLKTLTVTELKAEITTTSLATTSLATATLAVTDLMTTTSASPREAATASEPPTPGPTPSASKAWIAGPVVGGMCAIGLLLGGIWFLRRRRRRRQRHMAVSLPTAAYEDDGKGKYEKAELHADAVPRSPPMELEGSYPDAVPEMGVNEVAARELPAHDSRNVS
ncbi:glycoprotein X [Colletotrichum musicola]|uniref:Glycoprotein X n=1 Tax=Colletotrichum musicola TaxID=2175873 RepID=A0A8H6NXV2_9PEZI|nr:glycoprotein X [Colletotrichum musicola]